jgi:hypothetical protein
MLLVQYSWTNWLIVFRLNTLCLTVNKSAASSLSVSQSENRTSHASNRLLQLHGIKWCMLTALNVTLLLLFCAPRMGGIIWLSSGMWRHLILVNRYQLLYNEDKRSSSPETLTHIYVTTWRHNMRPYSKTDPTYAQYLGLRGTRRQGIEKIT